MSQPYENLSPSLGVRHNAFGDPIGKALPDWQACTRLPNVPLTGRYCQLVPYAPALAEALYRAYAADDGRMWTYLPYGPFSGPAQMHEVLQTYIDNRDFQTFVILKNDQPAGLISFMRYDYPNGSVEVGGVTFSPTLRRSTAATEAIYLMTRHAFAHDYRRYEWKCDQLNVPSNKAALRFGFQFEGVFRNAAVVHGRRRDTAWYAIIAEDWPRLSARLEAWLDPGNFAADGQQKRALSAF
ncbi:GNAT family protein [Asticcacaulis sp. EMRT-3]|uniref:GNAT family N-acetyltransferase n=1 Tax=Asticcacaulis sp. EMRT-3 TaxID=3040349 RepID=UPI0024AFD1D8|nr:GNAT family protein [Asticcacaulis sp. EMRT-3]MDI7774444.1 GNAT family protein [Asticcacaulis sp. EMRT-3]